MPFTVDMMGVRECVQTSSEWRAHCDALASKGVNYAQSIAPVLTGRYRASLYGRIETAQSADSVHGAPAAHIGTDIVYGMAVEYRWRHHVLQRTLEYLKG